MKKEENQQLAVIPTAELLSEMESLVVFGGNGAGGGNDTYIANCDINSNSYCADAKCGNCVAQCGCVTPPGGGTIGSEIGGPTSPGDVVIP